MKPGQLLAKALDGCQESAAQLKDFAPLTRKQCRDLLKRWEQEFCGTIKQVNDVWYFDSLYSRRTKPKPDGLIVRHCKRAFNMFAELPEQPVHVIPISSKPGEAHCFDKTQEAYTINSDYFDLEIDKWFHVGLVVVATDFSWSYVSFNKGYGAGDRPFIVFKETDEPIRV